MFGVELFEDASLCGWSQTVSVISQILLPGLQT